MPTYRRYFQHCFTCAGKALISDQEKRILESSPAGIKLICSEKLFREI